MRHPNPDILLRIAQGDAYGMATEYIKMPRDREVRAAALKFVGYVKHPTHKLAAGSYTDDTQMSIAVSEVLLGEDLSREAFAEAFVRCFVRDPRDGYSRNFQVFLEKTKTGEEFLKNINPDSDKNGAAMRSVPLGVLPNPDDVRLLAAVQAALTHDTPDGILSSQAVALMSHFALHSDGEFNVDLEEYLDEHLPAFGKPMREMSAEWPFRVAAPRVGMRTAVAVACLLQTGNDLMDVLNMTIEAGGDTDSVAAIAWGIASARMPLRGMDFLEEELEPGGQYGPKFLKELGNKLMEKFA